MPDGSRILRRRAFGGFAIEIVTILVIAAVLAGIASLLPPRSVSSGGGPRSWNNLGAIGTYMVSRVTSRGGSYKIFPYSGKNFTLAPIAYRDIDIEEEANLRIFFSPGDRKFSLAAVDRERYRAIDKKSLRTEDFHELTSYAGRRNGELRHAITAELMKQRTLIMCDDDDGPLHHPHGLMVCWSDGKAHYMEWDELGMAPPSDADWWLGASSSNSALRSLSSR